MATSANRSHCQTQWRTAAPGAIVSGLLVATSSGAVRAADYIITLDRGLLEDVIEGSITDSVMAEQPDIYWGHVSGRRVEMTQASARSINVDLDLAYHLYGAIPDPEVDIDLEIGFSCFWREPGIDIGLLDLDTDVSFAWYVDAAGVGGAILSTAADAISNRLFDRGEVQRRVGTQMNNELDELDLSFEFCPQFNVTSSADVQIVFGIGDECAPGEEREHQACAPNERGRGYDYTCVNGFWERTGYCERIPCDGCERP